MSWFAVVDECALFGCFGRGEAAMMIVKLLAEDRTADRATGCLNY